jgi:formylglycine-generating enzyme required for sulfatase activity
MVVVPAGNFLMGSVTGAETANDDEYPQHRVAIAKPFAIGKYEVTHAEWEACVAAKACERADDNGFGRGRRPVINVSSAAAKRYAAWLSRTTGETYRLPSESEWEYAARAKTATRYPWGDTLIRNRANCGSCGSQWDEKQTAPVGSFAANGFGLHDMQGNVWEIVEDCVNKQYRGAPADGRPWLGGDCSRRVMRGGSWNNYHDVIRSAQRESIGAEDVSYDIGFRLVRELP